MPENYMFLLYDCRKFCVRRGGESKAVNERLCYGNTNTEPGSFLSFVAFSHPTITLDIHTASDNNHSKIWPPGEIESLVRIPMVSGEGNGEALTASVQ